MTNARAHGLGRFMVPSLSVLAALTGMAWGAVDPTIASVGPEENCGSFNGTRPTIAVDSQGQPHIVIDKAADPSLYIFHKVNGNWSQSLFARGTTGGPYRASRLYMPHIEIDAKDRAWISCKFGCKEFGTMLGQGLWLLGDVATGPRMLWFRWVTSGETHKGNGNVSLDPFEPDNAVVLATQGNWIKVNDGAGRIGLGNMNSGNSGEKIRFLISPRAGQVGVWHSAMVGSSAQAAAYQNSLRNRATPVTWAAQPSYPEQGSDFHHPGIGIDLARPEVCYISAYFHTGLCINIWDGTRMVHNPAALPVLDPAVTFGDRFGPQWTPVPGGGAYVMWSRSGQVKMRYVKPDGSMGKEESVCAGKNPSGCTDRNGNIHLAYVNGGMRYRLVQVNVGPPPNAIVTDVTTLNVAEGGTATFNVRLNQAPAANVTVTATPGAGDGDLTVSAGATRTFTPANWNTYQSVTVNAAQDADTTGGSRDIVCTATGYAPATVAAKEQDDDKPAFALRINCGNGAVGDWLADQGFVGGGTIVVSGATTLGVPADVPAAIYHSERYASTLAYRLNSVPNGQYAVRLHFAEVFWGSPGQRVFNVNIEGVRVLSSFDILAVAGAKNTALVREFTVNVADGNGLSIDAIAVKDKAKLSGIEVLSAGPPPKSVVTDVATLGVAEGGSAAFNVRLSQAPAADVTVTVTPGAGDGDLTVSAGAARVFTPLNWNVYQTVTVSAAQDADSANGARDMVCVATGYTSATVAAQERDDDPAPFALRVNCGGGAVGDWSADQGFSPSRSLATTATIAGVPVGVPMLVYQSERFGAPLSYGFNLANGRYTVRLHFCEVFWELPRQRIFNVSIEGVRVLTDFDIVAAAGGRDRAVVREFTTDVADGRLSIDAVSLEDKAKFSGIEVLRVANLAAVSGSSRVSSAEPSMVPVPDTAKLDGGGAATADGVKVWASGQLSGQYACTNLVDGNTNTVWIGNADGSPWQVAMDFGRVVPLTDLGVLFLGQPWPYRLATVGSTNGTDWFDLTQVAARPVSCRYLFLFLWSDSLPVDPPVLREVLWRIE